MEHFPAKYLQQLYPVHNEVLVRIVLFIKQVHGYRMVQPHIQPEQYYAVQAISSE